LVYTSESYDQNQVYLFSEHGVHMTKQVAPHNQLTKQSHYYNTQYE